MEPYRIYLHIELLDVVPARGEQRKRIMEFIRSLAAAPHSPGDFTDQDREQRPRQIKIIGRHAVTYWVDEPVKAVMVVDVRSADR